MKYNQLCENLGYAQEFFLRVTKLKITNENCSHETMSCGKPFLRDGFFFEEIGITYSKILT